ncbi:unnamed protein product [Nippostrongylus brasiliensis]|uniref:Secreted protein n=1 Tax=Nippostrongylus brasiliensis TaxID=27835 RepID=A0A0N4YW76_NIPBR|nr:unnamed protein product [Nippostrongylus brasiliensis]
MIPPWSVVCLAVTVTAVSAQYLSDVGENAKRNDFTRDIMHFGKRSVGFNVFIWQKLMPSFQNKWKDLSSNPQMSVSTPSYP